MGAHHEFGSDHRVAPACPELWAREAGRRWRGSGEHPRAGASTALRTSIYELGWVINRLRNKGGSGHDRPFLTSLSDSEVRAAQGVQTVAGFLLDALSGEP